MASARSRGRNSPWLHRSISRATTVSSDITDYVSECNRLGTIPVSYFSRHVHDTEFSMRYRGLGPLGAKAIARPLEVNTVIEKLDLEGNRIEAKGALYLARSLMDNVSITHLILSENHIGSAGAAAIIEMIRENGRIQHVDLSGNDIRDLDGRIFFYLLKHGTCVQHLALRHNSLSMVSAQWLRQALEMNVTLRELDLSWNHIRLQGAIDIALALKDNVTLKKLNLCMNGMGREGALALGESLKENDSLEYLDISSNRIHTDGATEISRALCKNTALKTLKMGKNPIEPAGCYAVLAVLDKFAESELTLLDMEDVVVDEDFETLHQDMMKKSRNVQVVHGGVIRRKTHDVTLYKVKTEATYIQDPMTKLRDYCTKYQIRMIDLFRRFDRDQSWTITREEFKKGIKSSGIQMEEIEIDTLIDTLDTDGTGVIDYQELIVGDGESQKTRRKVAQQNKDMEEKLKNMKDTSGETMVSLNL